MVKVFWDQMKPEDMPCVGCAVVDGPHVGYCIACEIRTCRVPKKVQNCAYCPEYKCDKLKLVHERSPKAKACWKGYRGCPRKNRQFTHRRTTHSKLFIPNANTLPKSSFFRKINAFL
ncbi:MAG: DUF3795 domain-containing protein [Candidatus Bathyarchaeia archaeon]|jgi:hypothetical protein